MNKILKAALEYSDMGFSVIPVKRDKKPYVKWEKYKKEKADKKTIEGWFKEWAMANVAIVTGGISGLDVIDVDSPKGHDALNEYLPYNLITPIARTPRGGWHYYHEHKNGLSNGIKVIRDCDFRGDGGYVVAPPSIGENRKSYSWIPQLYIKKVKPAPIPDCLLDILKAPNRPSPQKNDTEITTRKTLLKFEEGYRDNTLFHIANCLTKGGMPTAEIEQLLFLIGMNLCKPPFPSKEISEKLNSALKHHQKKEVNLTQEIKDYIDGLDGVFLTKDLCADLGIHNQKDKANVRKILNRFKETIIEQHGDKAGCFRKIEDDLKRMDLGKAEVETVNLWMPFNIHEMVEFMPGNIIIIAGDQNAGKTAFLLNVILHNLDHFKVHYFNSEMGESELKKRLSLFNDFPIRHRNFYPYERSDNFEDIIRPGKGNINIIDYLEVVDEFWKVGGNIKRIHGKLNGALSVIALQKKNPETDEALGGRRSLEKPRLALSLFHNRLKIIKAKNWKTTINPNGKEIKFKLVSGSRFIEVGKWN